MMRRLLILLTSIFFARVANSQVGIGTTNPLARLHVADSSVLFSAPGFLPASAGDPPISGEGRRMMWYPGKAAFRVGYVENNDWDGDSIGVFSFAAGLNARANGGVAISLGRNTIASGISSISIGHETIASGSNAVALGLMTTASSGYATAMGYQTTASGGHSTAFGANTTASAFFSTAFGRYTIAPSAYETVIGKFNTLYTPLSANTHNDADRLFVIGNGTDINNRSDALVMLKNGNTGLGTSSPNVKLHLENGTNIGATTGGFLQLGGSNGSNLAFDPNEIQSRNNGMPATLFMQTKGGNLQIGGANSLLVTEGKITRPATGTNDLLPAAFGKVFADGSIHSGTGNFTLTKVGTGQYDLTVNGVSPASATLILVPKGDVVFIRTITYQSSGSVFHIYSYRLEVTYDSQSDVSSVGATSFDGDFNFVVYYY